MAQYLARLLGEGANVQIALQELNRMTRERTVCCVPWAWIHVIRQQMKSTRR